VICDPQVGQPGKNDKCITCWLSVDSHMIISRVPSYKMNNLRMRFAFWMPTQPYNRGGSEHFGDIWVGIPLQYLPG